MIVAFCTYFPVGTVIGILTRRFSCKNALENVIPHVVWNLLINILALSLSVHYIFVHSFHLHNKDDDIEMSRMLFLATRIIALSLGLTLGSALQPVAITGGIACGKSTVSEQLSDANLKNPVIVTDLDKIAHDILHPSLMGSNSAYKKLVKEFGSQILQSDEKNAKTVEEIGDSPPLIDRSKLGDITFADRNKRKKLNSITHPLIFKIMMKQVLIKGIMNPSTVVAVDIPLFYETGILMRLLFGFVVVVACDPSIQERRLSQRNPEFSPQHCRERIDSQMPIGEKARKGNLVLWNNGSRQDLVEAIEMARNEMLERVLGWNFSLLWVLPILSIEFSYLFLS